VDTVQDQMSLPPFSLSSQPLVPWYDAITSLDGEIDDIETYAYSSKDFAELKSPWFNGITDDEAAAIHLYTAQWKPNGDKSLYCVLNKILRDPKRTNVDKFFPYLRLLYEGISKLTPVSDMLFRGMNYDKQYQKDEKIRFWGFSSTSVELPVVGEFVKEDQKAIIFSMRCQCGYDISPFSAYPMEKEVLVIPPVQFKVTGVSKIGQLSIVALEQDVSYPVKYFKMNQNTSQTTVPSNTKVNQTKVPPNTKVNQTPVPSNVIPPNQTPVPSNTKVNQTPVPPNTKVNQTPVPSNTKVNQTKVPSNVIPPNQTAKVQIVKWGTPSFNCDYCKIAAAFGKIGYTTFTGGGYITGYTDDDKDKELTAKCCKRGQIKFT